ncbi:MAG: PQQ-binding-like beta-propeller repeat protein [Armatimonadota bacterium]|nr:PQQ-binding-like beta-propeller repeat protein [Armatimonadota bacterium]
MRFGSRAIFVILLVLVAAGCASAEMVMARYDPTQSSSTSQQLALPVALKWQYVANKFDNNAASPIVVNGTAYFACGDRVYAVDLETGSLKWRYPREQGLGGSVKCTPAYYKGAIYFGATDENLYCLDAETGTFRWAYRVRGAIRCPPVIVDNMIYVGADDESLYAIEAETGERRWVFTARDDIAMGIAVGSGMVVAASMDGNLYGIAQSTGKLRWIFRLPLAPTDSSPVITESIVVMAVGNNMYGLSTRSGQQKWHVTLPAEVAATPAAQGYDVYVPCKDKKIYAYLTNARQPIFKWTQPADLQATPMSSPVVAGDTVWVTGARGVVAAFAAQDGSLKWRYPISPSTVTTPNALYCDAASSPTIADGVLLVLTDDGVLHCFSPDAADQLPPKVYSVSPVSGSLMSPAPPIKISAVLYDVGSGVDFSTAAITLDGQPVETTVDLPTSTVSYVTPVGGAGKQAVYIKPDGLHYIAVSAKDYAGNSVVKEWYIITDSSLPPPRRVVAGEETGKQTKEPKTKPTEQPKPSTPPAGTETPPGPQPPGIEAPPPPPPPPSPGFEGPPAPQGPPSGAPRPF